MLEPIYITGAGVVSAIGIGKTETLASLQKGLSGIAEMKYLRSVHRELPVGEVKLSNAEMMQMLGADPDPRLTRTALIGRLALREALVEARLSGEALQQVPFISLHSAGSSDAANSSMPKKTPPTACMPPSQPTAVQHLPI